MASVAEKAPSVIRDKCGTTAGYHSHRYRKETTCNPCRTANAISTAQWRKQNPDIATSMSAKHWAKYRANNSEKIKIRAAANHIKNSVAIKARMVTYWRENPEVRKAAAKRYAAKYPERRRASANRRRARKRGNGFEPYTEAQVLAKYGTDCYLCHEPIDMDAPRRPGWGEGWERGLHMEHIVAIANGGRDDLENIRPAHGLCNLEKSVKQVTAA